LTVGVVTGFLGAYTTFSMFAYETHDLIEEGHVLVAATNSVGSVAAGVAGIYLGLMLAGR
jgi:fluoride exporter